MLRTLILAAAILVSGVIARADGQSDVNWAIIDRLNRLEDIVLGQQHVLDQHDGDLKQVRAEIFKLGTEISIMREYGVR